MLTKNLMEKIGNPNVGFLRILPFFVKKTGTTISLLRFETNYIFLLNVSCKCGGL
jgi:hypothetical protein